MAWPTTTEKIKKIDPVSFNIEESAGGLAARQNPVIVSNEFGSK